MKNDNYEKYESMLTELSSESGRMAWSSGNSTVFYMILIIIVATVIACGFFSFANMLIMLFVFAAEGTALFIPVALYCHKAGVCMPDKCLDLDRTYPGIYDAYEDWKRRIAEKSISGISRKLIIILLGKLSRQL